MNTEFYLKWKDHYLCKKNKNLEKESRKSKNPGPTALAKDQTFFMWSHKFHLKMLCNLYRIYHFLYNLQHIRRYVLVNNAIGLFQNLYHMSNILTNTSAASRTDSLNCLCFLHGVCICLTIQQILLFCIKFENCIIKIILLHKCYI